MKKRILCFVMLVLLIALPVMDAFAATTRYIYSPNGKKVNVRHGPSDKGYAVAAQLDPGTEVKVVSRKNGWAEIVYNGSVVYVMSKYLSSNKPGASSSSDSSSSSSSSEKIRYIYSRDGKKVNAHTGPGEKGYAVATRLEPGTEVRLLSTKKGWSTIVYNGFTIYVMSKYLSANKPGSSSSSDSSSTPAVEKTRYIRSSNGKKVNVRTGPNEKGYAVAAQLEPGTEVTLISTTKKGWSKIRVNGFVVYVMSKYLTSVKP